MKKTLLVAALLVLIAAPAFADVIFVNGSFASGNMDGWALGSRDYSGATYTTSGTGLTTWSPGTNGGTAARIMTGGADPIVGIPMVYNDNAVRVGDSLAWGYGGGGNQFNWITQTTEVTGSEPGHLFFAWAAVLEISGHSYFDTPYFEVSVVKNGTTTIYDYLRYEQDGGFWTTSGGYKYSAGNNASYPGWYVEDLDLGALGVNVGDTLTLTALARDCSPSAHAMYVYLDGFGAAPPQPVPEPASMLLLGSGLVGLAARVRRSHRK